ncbi:MAG: MFS transporter [Bacteroidota bacterium]
MPKPNLSFREIFNMSFGFMGIQFGFALQNGNVSRIFTTLGAAIDEIAILWIAAPLTGLIVQPIIGYFSDRTWTKLGRRRPYFLYGAIFATLALFVMPNSPALWVAALMLWVMDTAINVSMEPFRAFVGDNLNKGQQATGFAMQTVFIGIGAVIASLLPWIFEQFGVSNTAPDGEIADTVKWSFYVGGAVFLLCVLYTVFTSKEYPPEELAKYEEEENRELGLTDQFDKQTPKTNLQFSLGLAAALFGLAGTYFVYSNELKKDLFVLTIGIAVFGLLFLISGLTQKDGLKQNPFNEIFNDMQTMPKIMKQLAIVQFFSWFALFAMWIYTTGAVTQHVYGTTDASSEIYNKGANWVGVCFAVYNGVAAIVAFLIPMLAKITSRKMAHAICLLAGAFGLLSMMIFKDPNLLLVSMIGIGIAWASILSMPYAMLAGSLPANKMGYYMGVFNFFIVIPQLVAASILGFFLVQFFDNDPLKALMLGGIAYIIAAFFSMLVEDKADMALKN